MNVLGGSEIVWLLDHACGADGRHEAIDCNGVSFLLCVLVYIGPSVRASVFAAGPAAAQVIWSGVGVGHHSSGGRAESMTERIGVWWRVRVWRPRRRRRPAGATAPPSRLERPRGAAGRRSASPLPRDLQD